MKVGLYSISCSGTWFNDRPALTVEEFIDTAKKYKYDGIELDLKRPHGSPLDLTPARCEEIRSYAAESGLEIAAMSANNNFTSPVPEQLENELLMVREQIKLCAMLGAPVLRLFVSWRGITFRNGVATYDITAHMHHWYDSTDIEIRERALRSFRECVRWAEEYKVVLALQNHYPVITSYKDMLEFVNWVDSPWFKCCFDIPCEGWTPERQSDSYVREAVQAVGRLQVLSHANAEFREREDGSVEMIAIDPRSQPVTTNYPAFVRELKKIGYEGYIDYEFCHQPFRNGKTLGYTDYIDDQIRLAQIYFRGLIRAE